MLINSQTSHRARVKVINDPIHGHFELPPHVLEVIDTPHVQRLRDLKQLGATYLVYPGASHNRFEHSLGVSHLSANFITSLRENPRTIHVPSPYDGNHHFLHTRRLVELAGLCHDLGHGPFSHLFDQMFLPVARLRHAANDTLWNQLMEHEQRSVNLFSHCVDKYSLDIDKNDINSIASLITGTRSSNYDTGQIPSFVYDVVANATNGIDTDKFDYIARDIYNIGLQSTYGFDHRRLIKFAKVIDDHICFHSKEVFNVYNMFLTRFQLHRTVYNHRAAISIDAMITDAFLEADNKLGISQSILNPADFLTMTDTILPIIEQSKDSALAGARHIIHRLRRRQLYRFVDEILLPAGMSRTITPEEITTSQDVAGTGVNLIPEDIYVADVTLNFGMKEQNPVDKVHFFRDWDDNHTELISSSRASYIIPAHFQEKFIRVYIRRECNEQTASQVKYAAQVAFRKLLKRLNLHSQLDTTVTAPRTRFGPDDLYDPDTEESGENTSNETETERMRRGQNPSVGSYANERLAKRQRPNIGNETDR